MNWPSDKPSWPPVRSRPCRFRSRIPATTRWRIARYWDNVVDLPGARHREIREVDAAAGGGAVNLDHAPVKGHLAFQRAWLDRHALDPTQCVVIEVRGESMEPDALPDGCSILVDRGRRRWRKGRIFVFLTGDGLIVKRADEDETGEQLLASDHPAWAPVAFPDDADILGEVAWSARTLLREA